MENRLDKFFKNKLDEKAFPFDESHWEEMTAELNKREKKNRPFFFWWNVGLSSLLLIGGFVAFFSFNPFGKYTNEKAPIEIAKTQPIAAAQDESTSTEPTEQLNQTTPTKETTSFAPTIASESVENKISIDQKSEPQKTPNRKATQTNKSDKEESISNKLLASSPREENNDSPEKSIENVASILNTNIVSVNEIATSNNNTSSTEAKENEREALMPLALINPPVPTLLDEKSAQIKTLITPIRKFRNSGFIFGLSTSGVVVNQRDGLGWSAGLFADYYLNKTWSIGFNPNFKQLIGTFDKDGSTEQVTYGFGRTTQTQTLTPNSINLLEAPLSLGLSFKRNRIRVGAGLSYSLAVQAEKITTQESDFTALSRLRSERGVIEEPMTIPQMSYFATAGYDRQWSRFSLGLSANYYQENYFQEEEPKENLITVEAKLKMNLFK